MRAACAFLLVLGCSGPLPATDGGVPDDAFVPPDGVRCVDLTTRESCADGVCETSACRGDEVCEGDTCVPWDDASLSCDFELTYLGPRQVAVQVLDDGFPRAQTESIRFTFGDGVAGQGEGLVHDYARPGIFAIELEIRLRDHRFLRASRLAIIDVGSTTRRPLQLTVDDIPNLLNGSEPFSRNAGTPGDPSDDIPESFHLLVPTEGFHVDIVILDDPADAIDRSTLSLRADVAMGARAAGDELLDLVSFDATPTERVPRGSWEVAASEAAPPGFVTFTLSAESAAGVAYEETLRLEAIELTPDHDPFDRELTWLFLTQADYFSSEASRVGTSRFTLDTVRAPNGAADLIEELALIGAQGGVNEVLDARFLREILDSIRQETLRYFGVNGDNTPTDDIPVRIVWEGEVGAPDPATFTPDGTFSMMRFGGFFSDAVGYSDYAPHNEDRVDDGGPERGIASAALISTLMDTPVLTTAFDPIKPGVGLPIGMDEHDETVLDPAFDPYAANPPAVQARYEDLHRITRYLGLIIAAVTAHEMGHGMGLMPDGPPPRGFFGGETDITIIGAALTNSHHADLPGLNLMQAGGNFNAIIESALGTVELPATGDLLVLAEAIAHENRLSAYSRAYLQGRLTYTDF